MWPWLRTTLHTGARMWDKFLQAAPIRVWAIILGAPPLCALVAWVISILADLAVQPEPVRLPVVMAIANMGYGVITLVGVIVCALAAVSLVVRGPNGWTVGINDDDQEPTATITTTTEVVVPSQKEPAHAEPQSEHPVP